jgi:chromosome segregation ATPase
MDGVRAESDPARKRKKGAAKKKYRHKPREAQSVDGVDPHGVAPAAGRDACPGVSTALAARRDKESRESAELLEMQKSVQRLREQRALVERIKNDAQSKDAHIHSLERLVQQLRSKVSAASLEALERERHLRSQLLAAEQAANATRETEEAMSMELRRLLEAAQRTESDLRHDLARALAEDEENRSASDARVRQIEQDKSALELRVHDLESQVLSLRQSCSEQGQRAAAAEQRLFEQDRAEGGRVVALEAKLMERTSELSAARNRAESMLLVYNRSREQLRSRESALEEAETRERLLQSTVAELEENTKLLRDQISNAETGDAGLRRQLAHKSEQLAEADSMVTRLRQDLESLKLESRMTIEECSRHKDKYEEYQVNLRNASVHRQRMELQLKSLNGKVEDLQRQLVHEMQRNAMLSRELDEERKSRTLVSKERLRLLAEVYEEESRLKETLEQPLFLDSYGHKQDEHGERAQKSKSSGSKYKSGSVPSSSPSMLSSVSTSSSSSSSSSSLSPGSSEATPRTNDKKGTEGNEDSIDMDMFFVHSSPATLKKPPKPKNNATPQVARKSTASSRAKSLDQSLPKRSPKEGTQKAMTHRRK